LPHWRTAARTVLEDGAAWCTAGDDLWNPNNEAVLAAWEDAIQMSEGWVMSDGAFQESVDAMASTAEMVYAGRYTGTVSADALKVAMGAYLGA